MFLLRAEKNQLSQKWETNGWKHMKFCFVIERNYVFAFKEEILDIKKMKARKKGGIQVKKDKNSLVLLVLFL